jgi:drug/metabolite transporter (DMT)-like permease
VTLIATIGVLPYVALQLQAVSTTFAALAGPITISPATGQPVWYDTAFIVALLMAVWILNEVITPAKLIGAALIAAGLLVISRG